MFQQQQQKEEQQKYHNKLDKYKEFFQKQLVILDTKINRIICSLVEMFYEGCSKIKMQLIYFNYQLSDIYDRWKNFHLQLSSNQDQKDAFQEIRSSIKNLLKKSQQILESAKILFQENLSKNNNDQSFINLVNEEQMPSQTFELTKQQESTNNQETSLENLIKYQPMISRPCRNYDRDAIQQCPLCSKQLSNGSTFVKHMNSRHEFKTQSEGFDCPHCDASYSQSKLLINHLYLYHYTEEQFQEKKRKLYFCPFTQQTFQSCNISQLSNVIRTQPGYSKALDEVLREQPDYKSCVKNYKRDDYEQNNTFVRGSTQIQYKNQSYICSICKCEDYQKLIKLGRHLKIDHGIQFRNNLFCPHCKHETSSSYTISHHLINNHGIEQETVKGIRKQVYQIIGSKQTFDEIQKLEQHVQNDKNYLTLFTSNEDCRDKPFGFLKQKINEENLEDSID